MSAKPVIAVPACRRTIDPHPFHVVGEKYIHALIDVADVLPLIVPVMGESPLLADVLNRVDGVFLTGSYSNVEPHHYGGDPSRDGTLHDPHRDATTLPLLGRALAAEMPVFAVCRGFQEVNVALGGTLHQHVEEVPGYNDHRENPNDPLDVQYGPAHDVNLVDGGMLQALAGAAPWPSIPCTARASQNSRTASASRRWPTTAWSRPSAWTATADLHWPCSGIPSGKRPKMNFQARCFARLATPANRMQKATWLRLRRRLQRAYGHIG